MNDGPDPLLLIVAGGAVAGDIAYGIVCHRRRSGFEMFPLLEAMLSGAGAAGAIHLVFCAFYPNHLVHLIDADGKPIHPEGIAVKLDTYHGAEIFVGAMAILVVSFIGLIRSCRHHHHQNERPESSITDGPATGATEP